MSAAEGLGWQTGRGLSRVPLLGLPVTNQVTNASMIWDSSMIISCLVWKLNRYDVIIRSHLGNIVTNVVATFVKHSDQINSANICHGGLDKKLSIKSHLAHSRWSAISTSTIITDYCLKQFAIAEAWRSWNDNKLSSLLYWLISVSKAADNNVVSRRETCLTREQWLCVQRPLHARWSRA